MKTKKVLYKLGDNELYDYFILIEKNVTKIDKESLAYQFDKTNDSTSMITQNGIQGNFDLVLERKSKNGDVKGLVHCNWEDIELL